MTNGATRLFLSALLTTSALGGAAFAETVDADSVGDEIVVVGKVLYSDQINALKVPTPIIDVPQSLSITTADQIIQQGFDSIGDIVLYTPGVNNSQGEGHRDAIVFRGVRSTADFYVDGVRDDVQYYRPLYNLEQVEILRGPNALLFGRGGTGGILNRVTKKGVIGEQFIGYKSSVDTFSAFDIQLDGNFSVSDNAAFRINALYESLDNHRDFFDGDRFGVNPTVKLALTPSTTLDVAYEYVNHERFVDRGIPAGSDGRPAEELADITFGDSELDTTELEAHIFRATLSHVFSDSLKGNFAASYADYDKLYSNFFPVDFDEDANTVTLDGYIDTTQRQNLVLTTNLIGEFETDGFFNHTIILGGEFIDTVNNNDRFNAFFDTAEADGRRTDRETFLVTRPITFSNGVGINADGEVATNSFTTARNDDTEADITVFSAYIQDQIEVADWLDIIVGVRFDSFEITVDNIKTFIETGEREILTRTDEEISPRFGVILKPMENISIYGSFSESFLPRSGEQFADINPPNDVLDPNTAQNLEIGLKWDFADRLSFTAAVFEIEESSPQVADDPGTLDVIDTEVRGAEAQIQGQITDNWYVSAGYSYLEGNQIADDGSDATNSDGDVLRIRELPEHTFNLWSHYQVTSQFGVGAGLAFQDESFADNDNTTTLPSYVRLDAAAYYDVSDDLRIQVNIENLTDTEYFPSAHTADNITVGAPINARFTVSGRF